MCGHSVFIKVERKKYIKQKKLNRVFYNPMTHKINSGFIYVDVPTKKMIDPNYSIPENKIYPVGYDDKGVYYVK